MKDYPSQSFSGEIGEMLDKVRPSLKEYFLQTEEKELYSVKPADILRRDFSIILFLSAETSGGVQRLVMKKIVDNPMNKGLMERENQAVVEYEILRQLHSQFANVERCSVPKPFFVVPEMQAFVMEFIEGPILSDELHHARYWSTKKEFGRLEEYFYLCGRWLSHFQKFTGIKQAGRDVFRKMIERCDDRLRIIEESGNQYCKMDLGRRVHDQLSEKLSEIPDNSVLICGRHGDFEPWNMIIGKRGISVIDFLGYQQEPLPVDLLKMLVYLEDEKGSLSSSNKRIDALKRLFLEGYGDLPNIPLPILLICETVHRVVSLLGNIIYSKSRLHHHIEAHTRIKKHLEWLTQESDKTLLWLSN